MSRRFHLHTFGALSLSAPATNESLLTNHRKRLAFLAALAADANGGVSRERLFTLLWPESDAERARNALNQVVFALRRDLGDDALITDALTVRLNRDVVGSDVQAFREAMSAARFTDAIQHYAGPFLDGVFLRDAPDFERWSEETRSALARDYERALGQAIDQAAEPHQAVHFARRLATHDPLSTHAALRLMRVLAQAGDHAAALRHATTHTAMLRAELETSPGVEFEREVARLQRDGAAASDRDAVSTHALAADIGTRVSTMESASMVGAPPSPSAPAATPAVRTRATPSAWRRRLGAGAVVLTLIAMVSLTAERARRARSVDVSADGVGSTRDDAQVVVARFTNRTNDAALDYLGDVAADWIAQTLSAQEIAKAVYGPSAYELSPDATDSASEAERARVLSARTHAGTVVMGSYYLVGDSLMISASVVRGTSGRVLRAVEVVAVPRSDPSRAKGALSARTAGVVATIVDPRLASVSSMSSPPPPIAVIPAFIDALELFRQGQRPMVALRRMIEVSRADSSFTLPLVWATWLAGQINQRPVRDSLLAVLERQRTTLTPIDRYALEFLALNRDPNAPAPQRLAAVHRLVQLAPGSNWAWIEAGLLYSAGRVPEAYQVLRQINPEQGWAGAWNPYWSLRFRIEHSLGMYDEQLRTAERSSTMGDKMGVQRGQAERMYALIALGQLDSAYALVPGGVVPDSGLDKAFTLQAVVTELLAHGHVAAADSLGRSLLTWLRARPVPPGSGDEARFERTAIRAQYLDLALQMEAWDDVRQVTDAMLADLPADAVDRDEYLLWAYAGRAVRAAASGDRAAALAEMARMPGPERLNRQMRWNHAKQRALVAGALRDRALTLRMLADMELAGAQTLPEARDVTAHSTQLRWISRDPAIALPYVGGASWTAPARPDSTH